MMLWGQFYSGQFLWGHIPPSQRKITIITNVHVPSDRITAQKYGIEFLFGIIIYLYPTQRVAEGIMFLTRLSVSQSVSPVFLVSSTPLRPLNRISWNFVVMKDIMCRCAYPQEILILFFFSELRPLYFDPP